MKKLTSIIQIERMNMNVVNIVTGKLGSNTFFFNKLGSNTIR